MTGEQTEDDRTSDVPGYQRTERLDRSALAAALSRPQPPEPAPEPARDPALAGEELPDVAAVTDLDRALGAAVHAPDRAGGRGAEDAGTTAHPASPGELTPDLAPVPAPAQVPAAAPATPEPAAEASRLKAPPPSPITPKFPDTAEIARRLPRPTPLEPAPVREVTVVDLPAYRLRRPGDLVAAVIAVVGVGLVLLLAVVGHATTEGVTEDVQNVLPEAVRTFLLTPVRALEGIVTMLLPVVIAVERLIKRQPRLVGEAVLAALVAVGLLIGANELLTRVGPEVLADGLRSHTGAHLAPIIGGLAAYLTVNGASDRRRLIRWTWNLLWITLLLQVLRSGMSLPAALASVLVGRAIGLFTRYLTGVLGDRAYGLDLVRALRRCGVDPVRVLRLVDGRPVENAEPTVLVTDEPIGYVSRDARPASETEGPDLAAAAARAAAAANEPVEHPAGADATTRNDHGRTGWLSSTWDFSMELQAVTAEHEPVPDTATATTTNRTSAVAPTREGEQDDPTDHNPARPRPALRTATAVIGENEGENRIYLVRDSGGQVWDIGVLDGDRQVVGTLASFWSTIRLRGLSQRTVVSLRNSVEHTALMSYAAKAAGVRTPALRGLTSEQDSAVLVSEHVPGTQALADVQTRRLTDEVLDRIWQEVTTAHAAGLAHRNLDDQAILLDGEGRVWLTGWASGETSSPQLARRLDLASVLALLALRLGPERAMASAVRSLTTEDLQAIAPILQPVALPERTRAEARKNKKTIAAVRDLLVAVIPTAADVPLMQMRRFSAKTILTATIAVIAGWIVMTTFNISEMVSYLREANAWMLVVAFALGLSTYVGAALSLAAFSPFKLGLWKTTLVQVAASVVGLVTPAGFGPAALNLRFLQKRKLDTPMAVATVTLVQVAQFVTTILMLVIIALATGSSGALDGLPSGAVLIVIGAVVVLAAGLLLFPAIRRWAMARIMPTLRQVWPRLVWVVGQPSRLALGLLGNVVTTVGYVAAFGFTLLAFDATVPLTSLALIFLAGNAAGSLVPTPGGIGAVELALTQGLRTAGVATAVAFSTAFVFRLLTFWIRVPLGWLALRYLQKRELV